MAKPLFDFQYGLDVLRGTQPASAPESYGTPMPDDELRSYTPENAVPSAPPPPSDAPPTATTVTPANSQNEMLKAFIVVVVGIVAHWIWEVITAGFQSGVIDFGTAPLIIGRVVVSAIVGAVSFIGIWRQLEGVDSSMRLFTAFTQGFAIDALASPVIN